MKQIIPIHIDMRNKLLVCAVSLSAIAFANADETNAPAMPTPPPASITNHASGAPPNSDSQTLTPTDDVGLGSDGNPKDVKGYQVRIGELYAPDGEAYLIPIRLPSLPPGQQFKSLHFRGQLVSISNDTDISPLVNADLYVVGLRENGTVVATDFFQGVGPDKNATLIQAGFLTPESPVRTDGETGPFVETNVAADKALTKYVNELYAKGDVGGKYLLLRVNYAVDTIPPGNNAYYLLTSGAKGDKEKPALVYELEPKK